MFKFFVSLLAICGVLRAGNARLEQAFIAQKASLIAMEVSEEGNKAVGKLARQNAKQENLKKENEKLERQNYHLEETARVDSELAFYKHHLGRSPSPNTRKQIIIGAEFEHAEHEASRETLRYVPFCNALNTTLDLLTGDITWGEATWEFTKDVTCVAVANKWLKKASEVSTAFKKVRNAKNIAKVEGVVVGIRPTHRQSEMDISNKLGSKYQAQQSFKNGERATYASKDSVRPDLIKLDLSESIEIKNYNLNTNAYKLINEVVKQAVHRKNHLPQGMLQKVVIDARGQSINKYQKDFIKQSINNKSDNIIKLENIEFKME